MQEKDAKNENGRQNPHINNMGGVTTIFQKSVQESGQKSAEKVDEKPGKIWGRQSSSTTKKTPQVGNTVADESTPTGEAKPRGGVDLDGRTRLFDVNQSPKKDVDNIDNLYNSDFLDDIEKGKHQSRILLDLFAASVSPRVSPKGWHLKEFDKVIGVKGNFDPITKHIIEQRPNSKMVELMPKDFINFFFSQFNDLLHCNVNDFEVFHDGGGYNSGLRFKLGKTAGVIQFRYFDPEKADEDVDYSSGSAYDNYLRQKINIKFEGDGLQTLRTWGVLGEFLQRLWEIFEPSVTMFDDTIDMFNYDFKPRYFAELADDEPNPPKYIGPVLSTNGDRNKPTVYIGAQKGARTIMMYDKAQEIGDKKNLDEPKLFSALKNAGNVGNWFRLEQHFNTDQKEAQQVFNNLMKYVSAVPTSEANSELTKRLSMILKKFVPSKCRFLSKPRTKDHTNRIPNDKNWDIILETIPETLADFCFVRNELTIDEKIENFVNHGIGGTNFFKEVLLIKGRKVATEMMENALDHAESLNELDEEKRRQKEAS